jgi:MFS family permease
MELGLALKPHHRVFGAFFLLGIAFGSIFTRLGDIQLAMGAGQAGLGVALIGTAVGMMVAVTFLAPWLDRIGFKPTLLVAMPMMGLLTALASLSPNPAVMFGWLVLHGIMAGAANTVINVEADRTEHLTGRRIMNRCHAIYSFGFLSAALIGSTAKQFGISPVVHLLGITMVLLVAVRAGAATRDQRGGGAAVCGADAADPAGWALLAGWGDL